MKRLLLLIAVLIFLMNCATTKYQGFYNLNLKEVEVPQNVEEKYGKSKIVNLEEEGNTKYSYEDDLIKIVWLPLSDKFAFTLANKTSYTIKIIWDEAVYVDNNNSIGRIMHSGVKYVDRNNSQIPSIIIKNGIIDDAIIPTDNIYYQSGQYGGGWKVNPIFKNKADSQEELNILSKKNIGKEVKIVLPLKIQETINEYIFTFKVKDFTQVTYH